MNDVVHDDSTGRDFHIGGNDAGLTPVEQLEQLSWYIQQHYPRPSANADIDRWVAMLPDRITHAAMLMLGSAKNHAMPGVAFLGNIQVTDLPHINAVQFTPSAPTGRWAISLHGGAFQRGSGLALENAWRPEVAAAAELSGTTIIDIDYPLLPTPTAEILTAIIAGIEFARAQGAIHLSAWGTSAGAALATLVASRVDALLLTRPSFDTSALGVTPPAPTTWPPTMMQIGSYDTTVKRWEEAEAHAQVKEYIAEHLVATPEVARQRIQDAATFLRGEPLD